MRRNTLDFLRYGGIVLSVVWALWCLAILLLARPAAVDRTFISPDRSTDIRVTVSPVVRDRMGPAPEATSDDLGARLGPRRPEER